MMRRFFILTGGIILSAALAVMLSAAGGCREEHAPEAVHADEHADHDHGEENEHSRVPTIGEIESAQCEHGMAAYRCDECRYEVGVVRVAPDLFKKTKSDTGGLLVTETVSIQPVRTGLEFTGEIQLNENEAVHVSPRIPGIIEKVYVDIGAQAAKGDLLIRINSVELGRTLAAYELNRSLTELSRKNYEREKLLRKQNISSEQELIEAQMAYETHKTELEAAAEALRVFGLTDEDVRELQKKAGNGGSGSLPVRASIDGTVIQKHAVVGELVEPGKDVMLIADLSSVWVWADIYEKELPQLLAAEKEQPIPVKVRVKAFPEHAFDGAIDYIGATMDERTRTVKVRATVRNEEGHLRPGMFCEIHVALESDEVALTVPKAALLSDEGDDFVFAYWKEDFYVRRAVQTGREFFNRVEVLDGLSSGDRILTEGAFLLKSDVLREKMGAGCAD